MKVLPYYSMGFLYTPKNRPKIGYDRIRGTGIMGISIPKSVTGNCIQSVFRNVYLWDWIARWGKILSAGLFRNCNRYNRQQCYIHRIWNFPLDNLWIDHYSGHDIHSRAGGIRQYTEPENHRYRWRGGSVRNSPPVDLFCKFSNSSLLPGVSPGVAGAIELGLLPR